MKKTVLPAVAAALLSAAAYSSDMRVTASSLIIREKPVLNSKETGRYTAGEVLRDVVNTGVYEIIDGTAAQWFRVKKKDGTEGYVSGRYLEKKGSSEDEEPARITLLLKSGKRVIIEHKKEDLISWFSGYDAGIGYYIIERTYGGEGTDYLYINSSTGEQVELSARPLISPDGKRLLVAEMDIVAGFDWNGIAVYRIGEGKIISEYEMDIREDWGPCDAAWSDSTTIRFNRCIPDKEGDSYTRKPAVLRLIKGRWTLRN